MALSKDWREFLELLNSRVVDYVIVARKASHFMGGHVTPGLGDSRATYPGQCAATS